MAMQRVMLRLVSAGIFGGGLALYAAQAGVFAGVASLQFPATAPTDLAAEAVEDSFLPDTFAKMQVHLLPPRSGFAAVPELSVPAMSDAEVSSDLVHRVAFSPMAEPARPDVPRITPEPVDRVELSPLGLPCGLDVTAEAGPAAMALLDVAAPCEPETELTIMHSGLTFVARTDIVGLLSLEIPAMENPAHIVVRLPDGTEGRALVAVPDLAEHDRIALSWRGDLGMELHALEAGAEWMSEGHVRPDAARNADAAGAGGGFLTLLGDAQAEVPSFAQVYSVPRDGAAARNGVALSIDAPITQGNCALAADALILRMEGGGRVEVTPLGFTYPGCDAVGDTLVLQNPLLDLRLAAN